MAVLSTTDVPHLTAESYQHFTSSLKNYDTTDFLTTADETFGKQRYIRAPYIDLSKLEVSSDISQLSIYADTVDFDNHKPLKIVKGGLVRIFARDLFRRANQATPVRFDVDGTCILMLYTKADPANKTDLPFWFETPTGRKFQKVTFNPDGPGSFFRFAADGTPTFNDTITKPAGEFDVPTLDELINEDGGLADHGFTKPDYLSRILRYQMLLAVSWRDSRPTTAIDIARYVCAITKGIGKALELNVQASTYLTSALLTNPASNTSGSGARFVPAVDLTSTKSVLKARLVAATSFDQSYQAFVAMDVNAKNLRIMANVALQSAADTQRSYAFIGQLTEQRYNEAKAAFGKAQATFQEFQLQLVTLQDNFKRGIEKWKEQQILKAVGEALLAAVVVVGSIAATVVAPPAGAAGLAAAGATVPAVAEGGAGVAATIAKMIELINKLKDLFEKIQPILEKLNKLLEVIQGIVEMVKKLGELQKESDETADKLGLPGADGDTDIINLGAQWDCFAVDIDNLLALALEEKIDGAREYRTGLQKLCILAKAILAAQAAVTQTSDEYLKTLTHVIDSERQTQRLQAAIDHLEGDPKIFKIYKEALLSRLLAIRTWVDLDFYSYVSAYMYYSLDKISPIQLDPIKPIVYYNSDAALLQAAVVQSEDKARAQLRSFVLSSADGHLGSSWSTDLPSKRSFSFALNPQDSTFDYFCRVRVLGIRCYIDGVSAQSLKLHISFDGRLADKDIAPDVKEVYFVTPARGIGFEYVPSSGAIVMDGTFVRDKSLLRPTPFTTWTVAVVNKDADLTAVTKVRLEMTCEVTPVA